MTEAAAVISTAPEDKRPQVETLLGDVFRLMDYPVKLEFKDLPDGSLGVAVHFAGELPGITPGKRSYLVDCVQFWLNKVVNRPNVPRRWVNLGVDCFPEPRMPGQPREPREPAPPSSQPAHPPREKRAEAPPRVSTPAPAPRHEQQARRGKEIDERSLTPAADPALTAVGKALAAKSARHGRLYGVMLLSPDARSLMLKAADEVKGVTAKVEGEGHWRRLVLVPEKPAAITRKSVMPDYDDEEEDE